MDLEKLISSIFNIFKKQGAKKDILKVVDDIYSYLNDKYLKKQLLSNKNFNNELLSEMKKQTALLDALLKEIKKDNSSESN